MNRGLSGKGPLVAAAKKQAGIARRHGDVSSLVMGSVGVGISSVLLGGSPEMAIGGLVAAGLKKAQSREMAREMAREWAQKYRSRPAILKRLAREVNNPAMARILLARIPEAHTRAIVRRRLHGRIGNLSKRNITVRK